MPSWKPLPDIINGFKIIEDLGFVKTDSVKIKYRLCLAECKVCKKYWKVRPSDLKRIISCHCTRIEGNQKLNYRLRSIFKDMKKRCYNKKSKRFQDYGGRNIIICEEWLNNPRLFYIWSLQNDYRSNLSIDRIDNDRGYSPDNCRWATNSEQQLNKRKK